MTKLVSKLMILAAVLFMDASCNLQKNPKVKYVGPDEITTLGSSQGTKPKKVVFVRLALGVDTVSNNIGVAYTGMATYALGNQSIDTVVKKVVANPSLIKWKRFATHAETSGTPRAKISRLSIRNTKNTYFAFVLECNNCRYNTEQIPFRVEKLKKDYLVDSGIAWTKNGVPDAGDRPPPGFDKAIGYFIANSEEEMKKAQGKNFRSHFNIYLELTYPNEEPVPISIDPDIGYPGGHEPPPCSPPDCRRLAVATGPAGAGAAP
jgi:hypothetical protein